ncbi:MAG: 30S ribosomal protein S12 methylthiotransferase RimO [Planctomycetes bacterium]|nr:30S ribosomal protein S12 methylthiotransferase RimO [Planctomycetota bacterium]
MKKNKQKVTVGFISLGCPKNSVDSERMLAEIAEAGFLITAEADTADVVVINTCGFIAPAKAESLEAIRHTLEQKLSGAVKKVIVAGCLPEREGELLFNQVDGIDAVVGLGQRDNIAGIIRKTLSHRNPAAYLNQPVQTIPDDRTRLLITPGHWAYLRISEGCNHHCSFCTIPAIRGRFRSKPPELVLSEADELISVGAVELNIIAQDSTSYGRDLKIKNSLAGLISKLENIAGLSWIRLMYLYPTEIDDKLIDTIAKSKKIVHYLDIPIQHINNTILKAMRRPDSKDQLRRLIEKLRSAMPDIILRTTVIVGFPGETNQQFAELLDFIKWAQFDALGCFSFYPESGTTAAKIPNQVTEKVKQQRLEELMLTQQEIAFTKNKNRIGSQLTCLVDAVDSKNEGRGRFYGQAPDIDSVCIIKNVSAQPGEFINTKVIDTKDYDLIVEQI